MTPSRYFISILLSLSFAGGIGLKPLRSAEQPLKIEADNSEELGLDETSPPSFQVKGPHYKAGVYKDGHIAVSSPAGAELLNAIVLTVNDSRKMRDVHVKDDLIAIRQDVEMDVKAKMPGMNVRFFPSYIELTFVNLAHAKSNNVPSNNFVQGTFGGDAISVRNLKNGREDALPAHYLMQPFMFGIFGNYWPDIEVGYKDGSHVEIHGIWGINHDDLRTVKNTRGFWHLGDIGTDNVIRIQFKEPVEKQTRIAAPYCTMAPGRLLGVFYENEPVSYHLRVPPGYCEPGKWKLSWRIVDHLMRPVNSGTQLFELPENDPDAVAPQLIDVPLDCKAQMGFFRAFFEIEKPDTRSARRNFECCFCRIRPEVPEMRDLIEKGACNIGDQAWATVLGMRALRTGFASPSDAFACVRTDKTIDWEKFEKNITAPFVEARKLKSTVRSIVTFTDLPGVWNLDPKVAFDKWIIKSFPDETERQKWMGAFCKDFLRHKAAAGKSVGIRLFEPKNEPDLDTPIDFYVEKYCKEQAPFLKEGNPDAVFIGGGVCGLELITWIPPMLQAGGSKYIDAIADHPYTGLGFQEIYRRKLQDMWDILADFKKSDGGVYLTEAAWHRGWGFRPYMRDKEGGWDESHARHMTEMLLNAEGMRVPRDRVFIFYVQDHGYNEFFMIGGIGEQEWVHSAGVALQVLNENLRDTNFVKEEPLPWSGHHFQVFKDATRTCCPLFTGGEQSELELLTDAAEVQSTDVMGNRKLIKPVNGKFRVQYSGDVTYFVVGPGNQITPSYEELKVQPNIAISTLGVSATSSSGRAAGAITGDWTGFASSGGDSKWGPLGIWWGTDVRKETGWIELKLAEPIAISRVRCVLDYGGWEVPLRDFDILGFKDEKWVPIAHCRNNSNYNSVTVHDFAPVECSKLKLIALKGNQCLFDNDGPDFAPVANLRAFEVFPSVRHTAQAFFIQDPPAVRQCPPAGSANFPVSIKNVTASRLEADIKFTMPEGIAVSPSTQHVTIEPSAVSKYDFKGTVAGATKDGSYSIVAGVYSGEELISVDYRTIPIIVKTPTVEKKSEKP